MICSEFGSLDRYTNALSAYNIIEKFELSTEIPATLEVKLSTGEIKTISAEPVPPTIRFRLASVWIADDSDINHEFEYEQRFQLPGSEEWRIVGHGTFIWKARSHRLLAAVGSRMEPVSGTLRVVTAIRRKADGAEWLQQEYAIPVEVPVPKRVATQLRPLSP